MLWPLTPLVPVWVLQGESVMDFSRKEAVQHKNDALVRAQVGFVASDQELLCVHGFTQTQPRGLIYLQYPKVPKFLWFP